MPFPESIRTARLVLRRWLPHDRTPFARMNADPRVAEFLVAPLSPAESDALAERIEGTFAHHGFGFWAVEIPGVTTFAGFVGLSVPRFEAHFTPCVEIGWRLATEHWGRGYATEGARAALGFAFAELDLAEVVAFAAPGNVASRKVMEKIGMTHDAADDFDHPLIPVEHPLRHLVLYRARRGGCAT